MALTGTSHVVVLDREADTYVASERAALVATAMGFDNYAQADIETAVSEICSNSLRHADGGWVTIRHRGPRLEIVVTDRGPGFGAPRRSASGLGIGLEGARRLMGDLQITKLANGSRVTMSRSLPEAGPDHRAGGDWRVLAVYRAKSGQAVTGDACAAVMGNDGSLRVGLADGLGSGPDAALAADRVLEGMELATQDRPSAALAAAAGAAADTRGAAAAAVFVAADGHGLHAGLGDVSCLVTFPLEILRSRPGIVGVGPTEGDDNRFRFPADGGVLLWTDGVDIGNTRQLSRLPSPGSELEWMEQTVVDDGDARDDATLVTIRRRA